MLRTLGKHVLVELSVQFLFRLLRCSVILPSAAIGAAARASETTTRAETSRATPGMSYHESGGPVVGKELSPSWATSEVSSEEVAMIEIAEAATTTAAEEGRCRRNELARRCEAETLC